MAWRTGYYKVVDGVAHMKGRELGDEILGLLVRVMSQKGSRNRGRATTIHPIRYLD
jgi:hypothetical protein